VLCCVVLSWLSRNPPFFFSLPSLPFPALPCPTYQCTPFCRRQPSASSAYLSHAPHSAFGFFCHTARTTRLTIKLPASPVEHALRRITIQPRYSAHTLVAASPPPHSLVCISLLGSPRWLLSFAFALRSPHSALVLQQAVGGYSSIRCLDSPSLITKGKKFGGTVLFVQALSLQKHNTTFMLICPCFRRYIIKIGVQLRCVQPLRHPLLAVL
jgi:hypothetical protein